MTEFERKRAAFLEAISQDRYDREVRLVYADLLNENGLDAEAEEQRRWTPEWQKAWDWFTQLAADMSGAQGEGEAIAVVEIIEAGTKALEGWDRWDGTLIGDGMGFEMRDWYDDEDNRIAYWENWTAVTRRDPSAEDPSFSNREVFRCCY